jgi:alpha-glucosidase
MIKKMRGVIVDKDNNWWKRAVFYQIYPRSFADSNGDGIGDLRGIISRLDYLNDGTMGSLGIDGIWLSPFFKSPDYDYGYDIADFCAVDPRYGNMEDFDLLLEEAHKRQIRVILDLVVNHTSIEHPWFVESRSSVDNPKRNWYVWRDGRAGGKKPPNNWRNNFFGPAWSRDEASGQFYLHSFLKEQPDLNWGNPEVLEAVKDVIRFWLDRGVNGFRLDVAHIYCKDQQFRDNPPFYARPRIANGPRFSDRTVMSNIMKLLALPELQVRKYNQHLPETHGVLKEFRKVYNAYPAITSVGEIIADDPAVIASYYGSDNDELHMNFYFEMLHCPFKAGSFRRCVDRWEKNLPEGAWPAYTLSNHDVTRAISRYSSGGTEDARARLLAMMLLTLRGTPFIYYGEEIGMKEAKLPKDKLKDPVGVRWYPLHRGRDGCRTPMQWSGGEGAGFTKAEPWLPIGPECESRNVEKQACEPASLLSLIRQLIWKRKELPALLHGDYRSLQDGVPDHCYLYLRETEHQKLLISLNFSNRNVKISPPDIAGKGQLIISTSPDRPTGEKEFPLDLLPLEGCIMMI